MRFGVEGQAAEAENGDVGRLDTEPAPREGSGVVIEFEIAGMDTERDQRQLRQLEALRPSRARR